ncbi:hypothetical protein [Yoonia sediminilitoris]|uniref:Uncharacterized protein n=1 Tax=Yoonia sediminilitoris TaxID=1286148 RepID=A0A2T6KR80_9RHOB|nr:hypothetical protein [Yoonia sediminilitoris]PUB19059.1 hypothetical protein C8N45_101650 [Yoonia sediminilitoris]RCW99227.1 hypothetical protein DFP92_101650 [Yoonia sediminilitoris]
MNRKAYFLPFAALTIFVAYLGLRIGDVPTETEIINRYAAAYLETAGDGARPTDCAATPHPDPAIRMIIACTHPSGVLTTYYAGPRGESVPQPEGPSA